MSVEKVGEDAGISKDQVRRYIRLTYLIPELIEMVDNRKIALNPAVELSYLKPVEQKMLLTAMDSEQASPSLSQAQRLKRFSQDGRLSEDSMFAIMSEEKKKDVDRISIPRDTVRKFFPKNYTPKQMEDTIIMLLKKWNRSLQQNQDR